MLTWSISTGLRSVGDVENVRTGTRVELATRRVKLLNMRLPEYIQLSLQCLDTCTCMHKSGPAMQDALSASKREASASAAGLGWCEQMSTYTSMHICTPNVSYIARITHICRTTRTKKLGYSPEESIRVYRRPTGCLNIWYCAHSIVVCEPMRTICLVSRRLRRTTTSSEGFALSDGALNPISASHQCISSHCPSECRAVGVSCIDSKYTCHIIAYHG